MHLRRMRDPPIPPPHSPPTPCVGKGRLRWGINRGVVGVCMNSRYDEIPVFLNKINFTYLCRMQNDVQHTHSGQVKRTGIVPETSIH